MSVFIEVELKERERRRASVRRTPPAATAKRLQRLLRRRGRAAFFVFLLSCVTTTRRPPSLQASKDKGKACEYRNPTGQRGGVRVSRKGNLAFSMLRRAPPTGQKDFIRRLFVEKQAFSAPFSRSTSCILLVPGETSRGQEEREERKRSQRASERGSSRGTSETID